MAATFQRPDVNPAAFTDVLGAATDTGRIGVIGSNSGDSAFGFLAGQDLQFSQHAGVYGQSDQQGVMGLSTSGTGTGVYGGGTTAAAGSQIGVRGETQSGVGVQGKSFGEGVGIQGISLSGNQGLAGRFIGNVHVQGNPGTSSGDLRVEGTSSFGSNVEIAGDLTILNGRDIRLADFAEDFDVSGLEEIEPGSVVVLDDEGSVRQSRAAYDHKVAGVVSGAGNFRSAITLDRHKSPGKRKAIALMGKVYCKVDAQYSAIGVGDLLTTSSTPGHAMKAVDPLKAFGSVIGKALRPLNAGQGLIPILIALQ
jgi:hypothetical protein